MLNMITMKNNSLLIQEMEQSTISKGGIILPKEKYNRKAIVLSVYENSQIKVGDIILRNIGKSTLHKINNERCEIISENDVLAVIGNIKENNG